MVLQLSTFCLYKSDEVLLLLSYYLSNKHYNFSVDIDNNVLQFFSTLPCLTFQYFNACYLGVIHRI